MNFNLQSIQKTNKIDFTITVLSMDPVARSCMKKVVQYDTVKLKYIIIGHKNQILKTHTLGADGLYDTEETGLSCA